MSTISMRSPASSRERSLLGKIWATCKSYRVRRQNYIAARTLARMDDHTLKDMGIPRCEIYYRVYDHSMDQLRRRSG